MAVPVRENGKQCAAILLFDLQAVRNITPQGININQPVQVNDVMYTTFEFDKWQPGYGGPSGRKQAVAIEQLVAALSPFIGAVVNLYFWNTL